MREDEPIRLEWTYVRSGFNDQSRAEFRVANFHAFGLVIRNADVEILVQLRVPDDSNVSDVKNAEIALRRNASEGTSAEKRNGTWVRRQIPNAVVTIVKSFFRQNFQLALVQK